VATARRPEELQDLIGRYGDYVRAVRHDVRNSEEADAAVATAMEAFGRLDVVVNNAGYGQFAPFEQLSADDFKGIVDACFYGVIHTTRAALPIMRKQRNGVIFQVSSVGGRITRPGNSPYHAAKWAVSGFAEALAQETAAFGVQVCALEPGGIRTNWGLRANSIVPIILPEYEESVGQMLRTLQNYWGHENSDPKLIAELIVKLADRKDLPPHLLLGSDAVTFLRQADDARAQSSAKWRETSQAVDCLDSANSKD
jgi:NAD(P)-dependent dehydrogenase (short-subunit alcohol dehydrogenase family)